MLNLPSFFRKQRSKYNQKSLLWHFEVAISGVQVLGISGLFCSYPVWSFDLTLTTSFKIIFNEALILHSGKGNVKNFTIRHDLDLIFQYLGKIWGSNLQMTLTLREKHNNENKYNTVKIFHS